MGDRKAPRPVDRRQVKPRPPPAPPSKLPDLLVGEISKTWIDGRGLKDDTPISAMFEHILEVNRNRGYWLHSWRFNRMMVGPGALNETIIAVFSRLDPKEHPEVIAGLEKLAGLLRENEAHTRAIVDYLTTNPMATLEELEAFIAKVKVN